VNKKMHSIIIILFIIIPKSYSGIIKNILTILQNCFRVI